jgi:hypothetical protein
MDITIVGKMLVASAVAMLSVSGALAQELVCFSIQDRSQWLKCYDTRATPHDFDLACSIVELFSVSHVTPSRAGLQISDYISLCNKHQSGGRCSITRQIMEAHNDPHIAELTCGVRG